MDSNSRITGNQGVPGDNTAPSEIQFSHLKKRSNSSSGEFKINTEVNKLLNISDSALEKDEERLKNAFLNPHKINIGFMRKLISDEPFFIQVNDI